MSHQIIVADDFGLHDIANAAILEAARTRQITHVSLLVQMPNTGEAVQLWKTSHLPYAMGLHFNLVEGKAVSNPADIPALVNTNGTFHPLLVLLCKALCKQIPPIQVERELRAQLEIFDQYGLLCAHINSHQNIHIFSPFYEVVQKVAQEKKIPHVRNLATIRQRIKKFPHKYLVFLFFYTLLKHMYRTKYDISPADETMVHLGTTYDNLLHI